MTEDTSQNTFEDLLDAALDRQLESERAVRDVLEEVRDALARLAQSAGVAPDGSPALARAIEDLRSDVRAIAERPAAAPGADVVGALRDVRESLHAIETSSAAGGPVWTSTLDEIRRQVNILADRPITTGGGTDLSPLLERLDALAARLDVPAAPDMGAVERRLDGLAERLEGTGAPDLSPLERRLDALAEQLQDSGAPDLSPLERGFHALMDRLDALEDRLHSAAPMDEAAVARLDALEGRLSTLPGALDEAAIARLHSRLDAIEERVTAPTVSLDTNTAERLEILDERIEGLAAAVAHGRSLDPATVGAIDSILAGLEELRGHVAELGLRVVGRGAGDEEDEDLRVLVEASAEDTRGLAQAMLDLNAGLRSWAERIDERISALARSVLEAIRDLAAAQKEAFEDVGRSVVGPEGAGGDVAGALKATTKTIASRLKGLEERIVESGDLSRYLKDQIEDLDRVLGTLTGIPEKLDGVVAQAVRRASTARAGIAQQSQKALEEVLGPVGGDLERFAEVLRGAAEAADGGHLADEVRRVALHQVELTSRLEALQDAIASSLDGVEEQQRRRDEAFAKALDRAGRGLDPKALDSIRASTPARRTGRASPKTAKVAKASKTKKTASARRTTSGAAARGGRSRRSKKSSS